MTFYPLTAYSLLTIFVVDAGSLFIALYTSNISLLCGIFISTLKPIYVDQLQKSIQSNEIELP